MLSKMNLRRLGLSTALLLATSVFAAQAAMMPNTVDPVPGTASVAEMTAKLHGLGFTEMQTVEHSGNVYTAKAKWEGNWVDLTIDAQNGAIVDRNAGDPVISIGHDSTDSDVRNELQRVGYGDIGPIERSGNVITTTAFKAGGQFDLRIDTKTGSLSHASAKSMAIATPRKNLTTAEMREQLRPLGYIDVRDFEEEGNVYSMLALKEGRWIALQIDAVDGGVTVRR